MSSERLVLASIHFACWLEHWRGIYVHVQWLILLCVRKHITAHIAKASTTPMTRWNMHHSKLALLVRFACLACNFCVAASGGEQEAVDDVASIAAFGGP